MKNMRKLDIRNLLMYNIVCWQINENVEYKILYSFSLNIKKILEFIRAIFMFVFRTWLYKYR